MWDDNRLEEYIATFDSIKYAQKFCDLMTEHDSITYVIVRPEPPVQEKIKEKSLEAKFKSKLRALEKDFATVEKEDDYDFER